MPALRASGSGGASGRSICNEKKEGARRPGGALFRPGTEGRGPGTQ